MKNIIFVLFLFGLTQCSVSHVELEKSKIHSVFIMHSSPTFEGYFYCGSDDVYHYFSEKHRFGKTHYYKIQRNSLSINTKYENNRGNELRLDFFGKPGNIFYVSDSLKLYAVDFEKK